MAVDIAKFRITENPNKISASNPNPAAFDWDADTQTAPRGPWEQPIKLRSNRTDYVGSDIPTEQVLGSNFEPFTLEGIWDNRYNGGAASDFARGTYESFKAMVRRGNPVRIEWDHIQVTGLITDFVPTHYTNWRIGYKFTVSPHYEKPGGDVRKTQAAPQHAPPPKEPTKRLLTNVSALKTAYNSLPHTKIAAASVVHQTLGNQVQGAIDALDDKTSQLDDLTAGNTLIFGSDITLSQSVQINAVNVSKVTALFQHIASDANTILTNTTSFKASSDATPDAYGMLHNSLAYDEELAFLAFDISIKDMRALARQMILEAQAAANNLDQLTSPDAQALYQTYQGETLQEISNIFYGVPDRWVEIYTRNNLVSPIMTGMELLVIPINGLGV